MIRISISWVVEVASALNNLDEVKGGMKTVEAWSYIYSAKSQLDALMGQSLYRDSLVTCRNDADNLNNKLTEMLSKQEEVISEIDAWLIDNLSNRFKTVFLAELATLPSYFVSPKRPFDTNALLDVGSSLMPADLAGKVPNAIFDLDEAGKCLAFERGTAAAFHLFRVLEAVVRAYYQVVLQGAAEPKQRNLGVYIRALQSGGANPKIIAALIQIKDLHRNPIAHPEVAIPWEEAININGLVRSAVAAMLVELPSLPRTTVNQPPQ